MICKIIEVRDRATFAPMLAVKLGSDDERERWLLDVAGFGDTKEEQESYVVLMKISGGSGHYSATADPFDWVEARNRTYFCAHRWLSEHFDEIPPGGVLDVEFVLGESKIPKESEYWLYHAK